MYDDITMILFTVIIITIISLILNSTMDILDRTNYCKSMLPSNNFTQYKENIEERSYCYTHIEEYKYQDRYFDIPPRDYK